MQIDYTPAKIIHWDYEKNPLPIERVDNYYQTIFYFDEINKVRNGVLIKCVVRHYKETKVTLDCICEQLFMSHEFHNFGYDEMRTILTTAFNDFKIIFREKYFQETGLNSEIIQEVKKADIDRLLSFRQG